MHGILGSIWPKMAVPFLRKVKDETLLVNCLYCVGFLVRFNIGPEAVDRPAGVVRRRGLNFVLEQFPRLLTGFVCC